MLKAVAPRVILAFGIILCLSEAQAQPTNLIQQVTKDPTLDSTLQDGVTNLEENRTRPVVQLGLFERGILQIESFEKRMRGIESQISEMQSEISEAKAGVEEISQLRTTLDTHILADSNKTEEIEARLSQTKASQSEQKQLIGIALNQSRNMSSAMAFMQNQINLINEMIQKDRKEKDNFQQIRLSSPTTPATTTTTTTPLTSTISTRRRQTAPRIRNNLHSRCLDSDANGHVYTLPCDEGNDYQEWEFINNGRLRNIATGRCLYSSSTTEPFQMNTASCTHASNVMDWEITSEGQIRNGALSTCIYLDDPPYTNIWKSVHLSSCESINAYWTLDH